MSSPAIPSSVRVVAAIVASGAGAFCGLAPLGVSAVIDHRGAATITALVGTLAAAALLSALTVCFAGTISEHDAGGSDREQLIAATTAATLVAVASMGRAGALATGAAVVAAGAALAIGYVGPAAQDRVEIAARRRLLADALDTPPGRLPEPWLVVAAREADAEDSAAGTSIALGRGLRIAALAGAGSILLAVVLGTLPNGTLPGHVALAVIATCVVIVAGGVLGSAVRSTRPSWRTGRRAHGPDCPRRHSGALSFHRLPVGVDSLTLDVAPGEHVGLLVPPDRPAWEIAAAAAHLDEFGAQHVDHHGVDGRPLAQDDVLRQIAVVVPDITLIGGTLRDNLAVADGGGDDERLLHAAQSWGLLSADIPNLDVPVGASMWPPQSLLQLAAARAALSRPAVLVVYDPPATDAPTLSPEAIRALADDRTVIRVSDREESLAGTDFVVRIAS